mmetsp:Transcript_7067/g.19281  ORF Transcript_7067/g.19281 Transcript_7067/m.19281 type:complete len:297 (-) Transcript_7067:171-1061(-)
MPALPIRRRRPLLLDAEASRDGPAMQLRLPSASTAESSGAVARRPSSIADPGSARSTAPLRGMIKNTFIDVPPDESEDELVGSVTPRRGARTCIARLSYAGAPLADDGSRAGPGDGQGEPRYDGGDVGLEGGAAGPRRGASGRGVQQVLLQVPLEVSGLVPASAPAPRAAVRSATISMVDGRPVIELQVVVGQERATPSTHRWQPPPATALAGQAPAAPLAGRAAPPPAGPGGRCDEAAPVCCHWRTKGWCRYQDLCKFAHPENKCGAGLSPLGASALAARRHPAGRPKPRRPSKA